MNVLKGARVLRKQCPGWWVAVLRTELGLPVERSEYDETFNAAVKAWPDYPQFYFVRANFLLPRWYGTDGELARDLEHSANEIGGEAGDLMYARVAWNLHGLVYSPNLVDEYHLSWQRINRGLETIEQRYPDSLAVKNEAAHLAVLARDPQAAKKYFDQTKGQIDPSAWSSTNDFVRCASLVYDYFNDPANHAGN
jgi:hypothetical protein